MVTRIRFGRKLQNEGGEQAITVLLFNVSEIKVIVGHCGQSRCMHALDVLNNRGSSRAHMNDLERFIKIMTYRSVLFPAPAVRSTGYRRRALIGSLKTYAFHESTRVTPSPSILLTRCSRRTMLRFLYVVLSKRSSDLSTDLGETTSVEPPLAAGHLQNIISLNIKKGGREKRNNKRFILLISFDAW